MTSKEYGNTFIYRMTDFVRRFRGQKPSKAKYKTSDNAKREAKEECGQSN
jgi:hypothetical protein